MDRLHFHSWGTAKKKCIKKLYRAQHRRIYFLSISVSSFYSGVVCADQASKRKPAPAYACGFVLMSKKVHFNENVEK